MPTILSRFDMIFIVKDVHEQNKDIVRKSLVKRAGLAQLWEQSPFTNMARVPFPHLLSYVDWVCWFSTLLREAFLWVLLFSLLTKKQHLIWVVVIQFDMKFPQLVKPLQLNPLTLSIIDDPRWCPFDSSVDNDALLLLIYNWFKIDS